MVVDPELLKKARAEFEAELDDYMQEWEAALRKKLEEGDTPPATGHVEVGPFAGPAQKPAPDLFAEDGTDVPLVRTPSGKWVKG